MIFLLGFPKSGTSSFHSLFEQLGYESYHWQYDDQYIGNIMKENINNGFPLLTGILNKFPNTKLCLTQMDVCISEKDNFWPQITHFKQLYSENPHSVFILNKRNINNLLSSFKKWHNLDKRMLQYNSELFKDIDETLTDDEKLLTLFTNHYENVENFFASHPDSKFISYQIDYDTIDKLNQIIDIKNISTFPYENKN